jgi:tetratricopeptide (TPR) repeat protein
MSALAPRRRLYAYCPQHVVRFPIGSQDGPIACTVSPHTLTDNYPVSPSQFVELCTACDTIWPFSITSLATQCVYCGVSFGQRSLCNSCSVFTLTPNGVAAIACGGCGAIRPNEQVHHCREAGLFVTARPECPFCLEQLTPSGPVEVPPPAPPNTVTPAATPQAQQTYIQGPALVRPVTTHEQIPVSPPPRPRPPMRFVVVGVLLAVAIGVMLYKSVNNFGARIDRALAARHYLPPAQDSVYEIYKAEAAKHPDSDEVRKAASKIVGQLAPETDEHLASFYRDSDAQDWNQLAQAYQFLELLLPADVAMKAKHAYAEGQRLLVGHSFREAFDNFRRALSFDSKFVLAVNGMAKVYIQDGSPMHDEAAAIQMYQQAMATDPNFTWAPKNLGEYYMQKGQWPTADYFMSAALKTSPERASILAALGRIAYNRHNYLAARDYYQHALRVAKTPQDAQRYNRALDQIREKIK